MKNFERENIYLSLCGLNCALCSMRIGGHCPGCGGGPHHSCAVAKCSQQHGDVEYCFLCDLFPCEKYTGVDEYDSFITHLNQLSDIKKAKAIGMQAYTQEQMEKEKILLWLLQHYNAGRQKTLYCLAVNLLDMNSIQKIIREIQTDADLKKRTIKDKAAFVSARFEAMAAEQGIVLKLRKKSKDKQ